MTVAQYAAFIDDGGYETEPLWTGRGWSWRRGEYDSKVDDEKLREWLASRPEPLRRQPMWWDRQQRLCNRPVVGVCWFEAAAYAAWLDARLRARGDVLREAYGVRLPTEAEWEKAARAGDARPSILPGSVRRHRSCQ